LLGGEAADRGARRVRRTTCWVGRWRIGAPGGSGELLAGWGGGGSGRPAGPANCLLGGEVADRSAQRARRTSGSQGRREQAAHGRASPRCGISTTADADRDRVLRSYRRRGPARRALGPPLGQFSRAVLTYGRSATAGQDDSRWNFPQPTPAPAPWARSSRPTCPMFVPPRDLDPPPYMPDVRPAARPGSADLHARCSSRRATWIRRPTCPKFVPRRRPRIGALTRRVSSTVVFINHAGE
jgi:hypothetical protein